MNTIAHPVAPEEIMALVDRELSSERSQSLSAHIDQCAECRELAVSIRTTSQTLSNWTAGMSPVSAEFEKRLRVAAAKNLAPGESLSSEVFRRTKLWTWKHWAGGLAATAVLAALLLGIAIPNRRPAKTMLVPIREYGRNSVATGSGPMGKPQAREEKAMKEVPRTLATPGIAADSNGLFHGLGDHAQNSFSIDGHPIADQQGKVFSNQIPQESIEAMEAVAGGPMIARTVSLSIVVKDFDAGRASLDSILSRHNGYAAGLNVSTPQGAARTLQASLRIPGPQLASALGKLKALGRVEVETQNGEEVTQQHADLAARLKNSRETEQRLQDVLRTRTGKVKDVLEVEQEIARVRGEIEQMEAEQQTLEHRVTFSTIDLKLAEEYKAELTTPAPSIAIQLRNATVDGFRTAFQSFLALVLFLAESAPTLLLWLMILAFPAWLLWRRYQRSLVVGSVSGV